MTYFTNYEQDTTKKIGISSLVNKFSDRRHSHRSAWPHMLANQLINLGYTNTNVITSLKDDWNAYDIIILEHGMEFTGTFNLFEGASDKTYEQIMRLYANCKFYSMHHDMPSLTTTITKRVETASATDLFKTLESKIDELEAITSKIQRVDAIAKFDKLNFGDSHSLSQYTPGYEMSRNDGLTLFGALKQGLNSYIYSHTKHLRIYLGNIDIRHHLMRQPEPVNAMIKLIKEYEKQLQSLELESIEVVQALPIENESRQLPKTGQYKGKNFYGTWQQRTNLANKFNQLIIDMCERNDWKTYAHPKGYLNADDELSFDVMEKPQSVHISPEYYRYNIFDNKQNDILSYKPVTKKLF